MKNSFNINIPAAEFSKVTMSRKRFKRNLKEVIGLMIEFRDKYGEREKDAINMAINEHIEGMDECAQLQDEGSWTGTISESLYCKYEKQSKS
jgi:molybdopterin converting factor small subunit